MVATDFEREAWRQAVTNIGLEAKLGAKGANGQMSIQDWFGFAWNREVRAPLPPHPTAQQLNLGAGYREVPFAQSVDLEHGADLGSPATWDNFGDGTIGTIWAHGVFEHLEDPVYVLWQCQRVLMPGGTLNIVVPHGLSDLHAEDITHKHPFVEDTWRNIFDNPYYRASDEKWELEIHTQFIMGVVWRNLALFTQFVKGH